MKRFVILFSVLFIAILGSTKLRAQAPAAESKFYLKAAGGYFFSVFPGQFPDVGPYPPHDAHMQYDPSTQQTTVVSEKVLTGSYGAGARGGLTFGWNINRYVALEGSFNYYRSKKNLMTRELTTMKGAGSRLGSVESHGYVNAVDFAPGVVMSPGFAKVNPYVRFGMVIPLWGRLNIETDATATSSLQVQGQPAIASTVIHRKERVDPNVTLGFQGALGVVFPVAKQLDIFVEAEYRNVPVRSKKKEVTAYDESTNIVSAANGQVIAKQHRGLNDLSTAERHTKYETTLDENSNTPVNREGAKVIYKRDSEPSNDLKSYINIGGLGASAGLRWRL